MTQPQSLVVAITGGSCAGKSTFAAVLAKEIGGDLCSILHQDDYFSDFAEFDPDERELKRTHNHPDSIRWETLLRDLDRLTGGTTIELPAPGTRAAASADTETRRIAPAEVIIIEGHLLLAHEEMRRRIDVSVYLDVDPHERVLRRLERTRRVDESKIDAAISWYRRDVIPNYHLFTEQSARYADFVIPADKEITAATAIFAAGVRAVAVSRRHSISQDRSRL